MKARDERDGNGWIITEGAERYDETESAQPTSRLLDGSSDHGYAAEYIGYGTIDGVPVKAVYLLDDEDMQDADGEELEEEGNFDWDSALSQGRIVVDIDRLTEDQFDSLRENSELVIDPADILATIELD